MPAVASATPPTDLTSATTLAIILGASTFPKTHLSHPPSFANSANDFHGYLLREDGLGLPPENVLNLFDTDLSPDRIQEEIAEWLNRRRTGLEEQSLKPRDLIFYYVGHGSFSSPDEQYILAVKATRKNHEGVSSVKIIDLASTLLESALDLRRYLILDCCFAAAAVSALMAPVNDLVREKTLSPFPPTGTTLLCASDAHDSASAPPDLPHTVFTGTLLSVLHDGDNALETGLSMNAVGTLVRNRIRDTFTKYSGLPEVHTPVQTEGNIASIPLFPNAANRPRTLAEQIKHLDQRLSKVEREIYSNPADVATSAEVSRLSATVASLARSQADRDANQAEAGAALGSASETELFNRIPADVQIGIRRFLISRRNGYIWVALPVLILLTFVIASLNGPSVLRFFGNSGHYGIYSNPLFLAILSLFLYSTSGFVPLHGYATALDIKDGDWKEFLRLRIVLAASQSRIRFLFGGLPIENDLLIFAVLLHLATIIVLFSWG